MARADSRKISLFPANTAIPTGSSFSFINSGINYQITDTNFISALGVTGTIVQDGSVTGTAILDTQGTVNNIRNLEDGAGILTAVSAENGVSIKWNATQDTGGVALTDGITGSVINLRSIVAAAGVTVADTGSGQIQIGLSATPASTKTVQVNALSDFPTPSAGVITLAADTEYFISNDVDIGVNRFVLSNDTSFKGASSTVITITSSLGSGFLFTGSAVTAAISECIFNISGMDLISFDGNSSAESISFLNVVTLGATSWGTFTDTYSVVSILNFADSLTSGFNFAGTHTAVLIEDCISPSVSGAFVDLGTAVLSAGTIETCVITSGASGTLITGLAGSANVSANGIITALNNRVTSGLKLAGVTIDDARFQFALNDTIADTRTDGLLSMQGNATNTVIGTQSVAVLTAGTWVIDETSQMTGTTAGRLTLDTFKDAKLPITASVTIEPVSGGSQMMGACIAINGVAVANSLRTSSASSSTPTSITVPWQASLSNTDYVEIWVSNESGTTDVLVTSAILRVN